MTSSVAAKKRYRRSAAIDALLPKGSAEIVTFPRREVGFGEEGDEGDELFATAMAKFKAEDFGDNHCQARVIRQKLGQVGLFASSGGGWNSISPASMSLGRRMPAATTLSLPSNAMGGRGFPCKRRQPIYSRAGAPTRMQHIYMYT